MPLPRPSTLNPLLPYILGALEPSTAGGRGMSNGSPRMRSQEGPARGGPLAGVSPPPMPLSDAPLGFANAPRPIETEPGLGGILTDTLPNLRLEPAKPKLDRGKLIGGILGSLGDGLMAYGGLQPQYGPALQRQLEMAMEDRRWREKLEAEMEAKREAGMQPKFEQIGNTGGMFDPSTMSYQPIFTAPQPFELYARSLGYQPGTPEYVQAIEDYRAGTWGDEGVAGRLAVQQPRLQQSDINNRRSTGVSRENNIRSTSTSRGNNIRSTAQSNTNSQRSAETARGSAAYQGRGGRGSGAKAVAANGEPIIVKGGRWVYEKSGQPVN